MKEEQNMYSAMDVAIHIVNYVNDEQKWTINVFKLQRMLFLLQGFWLASKHQCRLFKEDMMAYPYGPAVPKVQEYLHQYGGNSIPSIRYQIDQETEDDIFSLCRKPWIDPISEQDASDINYICDKFQDVSSSYLLKLCNELFPCYYRNINRRIFDDDIEEDFRSLLLPKEEKDLKTQERKVLDAWERIKKVANTKVDNTDILLVEKAIQKDIKKSKEK